jgi:hypothetical protein
MSSHGWRETLDAYLEDPATWRHIAVRATIHGNRRHAPGTDSRRALDMLATAATALTYLYEGEPVPETVWPRNQCHLHATPGPKVTRSEWDAHDFTDDEKREANNAANAYQRGKRGPLDAREAAALRAYCRDRERARAKRRREAAAS